VAASAPPRVIGDRDPRLADFNGEFMIVEI
jgi:hypothetical protein